MCGQINEGKCGYMVGQTNRESVRERIAHMDTHTNAQSLTHLNVHVCVCVCVLVQMAKVADSSAVKV